MDKCTSFIPILISILCYEDFVLLRPVESMCSLFSWSYSRVLISLAMALSAAQNSCPCGRISLVSRMNPPNPLPSHQGRLSSTVYEYLIPTAPLAQSSDPPAAASRMKKECQDFLSPLQLSRPNN